MTQDKIQYSVNAGRLSRALHDLGARGFQQLAIFNAGRTRGFTRAATQAAINMSFKRERSDRKPSFFHRAHQVDAPAGTVILVAGRYVSGTRFQTEAAMNAGEDLFFFSRENACEDRWFGRDHACFVKLSG